MASEVRLIDVSIPVKSGMPEWDNAGQLHIEPLRQTPESPTNVTRVTLTTHTGTHVDALRHFIHDGATLDDIPLDRWVGPCYVADFTGVVGQIEPDDLERLALPVGTERLVLKTTNSELWHSHPDEFVEDFVGLSPDAARWIVEHEIRLVANDYLSIGPFGEVGHEVHRILLGNGVIAVEGLDLSDVEAGLYELLCFPLKVHQGDGAPARVALRGPLA